MLNVKKLLAQILLKLNGFSTQTVQLSSVTLAANGGTGSITGDASRSGYTPMAIVGILKSGAGSGQVCFTAFYMNGSTAKVDLYNNATASRTVSGQASVLYKKS